jgi:glutamate--cysteine ligase catalytic subunit
LVLFTGIDHLLALHISHLFIRDPVSLFKEKIHQDDSVDTDHFEVAYYYAVQVA